MFTNCKRKGKCNGWKQLERAQKEERSGKRQPGLSNKYLGMIRWKMESDQMGSGWE